MNSRHVVSRVRHPIRFRRLEVARVESITPRMRRIVLTGEELDGFVSRGFDDHVKLFFPDAAGVLPVPIVGPNGVSFPEGGPRPEGRDFTPRRYDAYRRELTIDFGLHASGPATTWATNAIPGSILGVAGPRGSAMVSDTFDWHLLVGDDSALPAIARRLEELPAFVTALVVVEVDDEREEQAFDTAATLVTRWVHRNAKGQDALDDVVASLVLPDGDGFAWVAGETALARRIRRHLIDERRIDTAWIKAAAYWTLGTTGKHEVLGD
jgi:NADPH-dependent ferric siderophore reductase